MKNFIKFLFIFLVIVYFKDGEVKQFKSAYSYKCNNNFCEVYEGFLSEGNPIASIKISEIKLITTK